MFVKPVAREEASKESVRETGVMVRNWVRSGSVRGRALPSGHLVYGAPWRCYLGRAPASRM